MKKRLVSGRAGFLNLINWLWTIYLAFEILMHVRCLQMSFWQYSIQSLFWCSDKKSLLCCCRKNSLLNALKYQGNKLLKCLKKTNLRQVVFHFSYMPCEFCEMFCFPFPLSLYLHLCLLTFPHGMTIFLIINNKFMLLILFNLYGEGLNSIRNKGNELYFWFFDFFFNMHLTFQFI